MSIIVYQIMVQKSGTTTLPGFGLVGRADGKKDTQLYMYQ